MRKFLLVTILLIFSLSPAFAKKPGGFQMPPPIVSAEAAKAQQWQESTQATGSLSAFQGIVVKPEISGRVTKIYFKSGQDVTQGTPLIALNQDILQAQLKLYKANLVLRQQEFKRAATLAKTHAMSRADFDTANANLITAEAQVDQATAQFNQTVIAAPFTGRLGLRLVSLGDYVNAGQNIVNLQSLDPIVVNFSVPEIYMNKVAIGDWVSIRSDSFPNQVFKGKVYAFDSVVDANTRTLSIRASIPNSNKILLPGAFVEVTLFFGPIQTIVTVPQTAVVSDLDGTYVYKVVNNKAVKTKVKIAKLSDQLAYIKNGLKANDMIVTSGQIKITEDNSAIISVINK
jgi:membrane fusion protein (multidrug efflux system)